MVIQFKIILTSLFMFQDFLCEDTIITTSSPDYEYDLAIDKTSPHNDTYSYEYYRRVMSDDNYCSQQPNTIAECLPKLNEVKSNVYDECGLKHELHENCEPYQCVFGDIGTAQDPGPYGQYIKEYIKMNPEMKETIYIALTNCIDVKLKPQGIMKNCSAFDTFVCIKKEVIKNMPLSLWDPKCTEAREYLIKCSVCPINCRVRLPVEAGTCNACADL